MLDLIGYCCKLTELNSIHGWMLMPRLHDCHHCPTELRQHNKLTCKCTSRFIAFFSDKGFACACGMAEPWQFLELNTVRSTHPDDVRFIQTYSEWRIDILRACRCPRAAFKTVEHVMADYNNCLTIKYDDIAAHWLWIVDHTESIMAGTSTRKPIKHGRRSALASLATENCLMFVDCSIHAGLTTKTWYW